MTWHLEDADLPNAPTLEVIASWRQLAITLSALDTYYWPQITHQLSQTLIPGSRPSTPLTASNARWLGLTLEQIERAVTNLRLSASFCDDTGEFYDLIRRASADAWKSLRGDAARRPGLAPRGRHPDPLRAKT